MTYPRVADSLLTAAISVSLIACSSSVSVVLLILITPNGVVEKRSRRCSGSMKNWRIVEGA